ncbi:hypothetical protein SO486_05255 [Pseudomonas salmasensis]|uniref:Glycosaminoglycan attachment site n=1 Tax=Pseudomonas salmasensis TaxID=2745514 RepID=A0ABU5FCA7_9PSED|nr:hypothetical protein [Pseudomonas salmasensis]MDY4299403.1 hypothetical protein [Pseudomonas salmasensis]
MDFFTPIVEESKQNKNFKSVLAGFRAAERELFTMWAEGFEDRDGKVVKEFQTTFNSTFWEVYLHACFREYGFVQDWTSSTPDFCLTSNGCDFIVEATTGNAAQGKPNEWDKTYSFEELKSVRRFGELNKEAMIRLSNAVVGKARKYDKFYKTLNHVYGKPFIIAVAPFEQPHFNLQYDRPIRALLYDYYVDEDAYSDNPELYPDGPPSVSLGSVQKDNGSDVPLGLFDSLEMVEVSAVVFSCVATWGKLSAMSSNDETVTQVMSVWATPPNGVPEKRIGPPSECGEALLDGLQVFHNPNARYPLSPEIFRKDRVVQHYFDHRAEEWVYEGMLDSLQFRQVHARGKRPKKD